MNRPINFLLFLFLFISNFLCYSQADQQKNLILIVQNINTIEVNIFVAVYDHENDYMRNRFAEAIAEVKSECDLEIELKIPLGKYAITIFHDVNNDAKLNTNFLGIPKEPYGFSNNPESHFGPPGFKQALFEFREDGQVVEVLLN